jgi:two-component system response regulator HydG
MFRKAENMQPKLHILIVDDDHRMTQSLADILTLSGYETVEAFSGPEALELIRSQTFDCVLTDVKMPGIDGLELYRRLTLTQPGLPVVLMTAYAAQEIIRKGLDEGVVGVFEKPLDINQLLGFFTSLSKNRSVAIVDDDPIFCRGLGDILQQRGFKVNQITDPKMDVEQFASNAQVVLLDIKLNHINGLDILKDIRTRYPLLPVLLVTGYHQEMAEVIQGAVDFQATVCLHKPLEIGALLQILTQIQLGQLRSAFNNA